MGASPKAMQTTHIKEVSHSSATLKNVETERNSMKTDVSRSLLKMSGY
jgi:hypothetical protein